MEIPEEYLWLGWLWAGLLVFHVTVFYYITAQLRRRNHYFQSIFFKIFLLHSLANYGVVATNLLLDLEACSWLSSSVCSDIGLLIYYFMQFFQQFSYTAIACNRFSAIVLPLRHESIWTATTFWLLLVLMIALSLACASVRLVQRTILLWQYDITFDDAKAQAGWTRSVVTAAAYFACFLVDAVLELWTFVAYNGMDFAEKRNHNEDYRLLMYALFGMVMNSYLVAYYGMIGLHIPYDDALNTVSSIVIFFQALIGPVFLLLTSKNLRLGYSAFYGLRKPKQRQITVFTTTPKNTATQKSPLVVHQLITHK